MALHCIDQILKVDTGRGAVSRKTVHASEEYFQDHFSNFPVVPGVLLLEGMVQSAAWCVRVSENFANSQVRMVRCSQAKYSRLVKPGAILTFEAEITSTGKGEYEFKGKASEDGNAVAAARFALSSGKIGQDWPIFSHLEGPLNERYRKQYAALASHVA